MKKGSMELGINAIVILIIAIVMLGVGIYFINSVLRGQLTDSIKISDSVKKMIRDDIKNTNKKMAVYGLGTDGLNLAQEATAQIDVGIGNQKTGDLSYAVRLVKENEEPTSGLGIITFYAKGARPKLPVGGVGTSGIKFTAGTQRGTAIYRVEIWDLGADGIIDSPGNVTCTVPQTSTSVCNFDCNNCAYTGGSAVGANKDTIYSSQQFFVTVN